MLTKEPFESDGSLPELDPESRQGMSGSTKIGPSGTRHGLEQTWFPRGMSP